MLINLTNGVRTFMKALVSLLYIKNNLLKPKSQKRVKGFFLTNFINLLVVYIKQTHNAFCFIFKSLTTKKSIKSQRYTY